MENLSNISVIKEICQKFGFSFSRSLGQNFLINPTVCPRIAEEGGAGPGVGVLEVGAGFGVLTHELAKRADKVVSVELDKRLLPVLDYTLHEHQNVKIVNQDVMEADLQKIIAEEFAGLKVVVCANLPYYITSPVIMRLLEERLPVESVTVMVQKEAGDRLTAPMPSRECGAVTAAVRFYAEPETLFRVNRGSFMPAPNVDSCVIRLRLKKAPPLSGKEAEDFFRLVKGAFSQRRKTLQNNLSSSLGISKGEAAAALERAGLKPTARAEELSLEEMMALSGAVFGEKA